MNLVDDKYRYIAMLYFNWAFTTEWIEEQQSWWNLKYSGVISISSPGLGLYVYVSFFPLRQRLVFCQYSGSNIAAGTNVLGGTDEGYGS